MSRSYRRARLVALGFLAVSLSGPALAETAAPSRELCAQWGSRSTQDAVRSVEMTAACRLPARIARRNAERLALVARPDAAFMPMPAPSRYASMLILGVGY